MVGGKDFKSSKLTHLGHSIPSDLINMCLQGLMAGSFELRRNNSIKSFSTKLEKSQTKTYQKGKSNPFGLGE